MHRHLPVYHPRTTTTTPTTSTTPDTPVGYPGGSGNPSEHQTSGASASFGRARCMDPDTNHPPLPSHLNHTARPRPTPPSPGPTSPAEVPERPNERAQAPVRSVSPSFPTHHPPTLHIDTHPPSRPGPGPRTTHEGQNPPARTNRTSARARSIVLASSPPPHHLTTTTTSSIPSRLTTTTTCASHSTPTRRDTRGRAGG
jgi:hypothetical protein